MSNMSIQIHQKMCDFLLESITLYIIFIIYIMPLLPIVESIGGYPRVLIGFRLYNAKDSKASKGYVFQIPVPFERRYNIRCYVSKELVRAKSLICQRAYDFLLENITLYIIFLSTLCLY